MAAGEWRSLAAVRVQSGERRRPVREAREWAAGAVARYRPPLVEDVVVVVSELVTNAVRHTRSGQPGGGVSLRLLGGPALLALTVIDDGGALAVPPRAALPAPDVEYGRGLAIVTVVAHDSGFELIGGQGFGMAWAHFK